MIKIHQTLITLLVALIAGCGAKESKILGKYDLEIQEQNSACLLLDLKTLDIAPDLITYQGGGGKSLLKTTVELSRTYGNLVVDPQKEENISSNIDRYAVGVKEKYTKISIVDANILHKDWDENALNPNGILFSKIYTFTLSDGKEKLIYSDDNQRIGITDFGKCIFRR
jgi:hypothetical protein